MIQVKHNFAADPTPLEVDERQLQSTKDVMDAVNESAARMGNAKKEHRVRG